MRLFAKNDNRLLRVVHFLILTWDENNAFLLRVAKKVSLNLCSNALNNFQDIHLSGFKAVHFNEYVT